MQGQAFSSNHFHFLALAWYKKRMKIVVAASYIQ